MDQRLGLGRDPKIVGADRRALALKRGADLSVGQGHA